MRRTVLAVLVVCLFAFQAAWPQAQDAVTFKDDRAVPPGRQGERIRSLIDTVNAGDADLFRRFLEEECQERFRNFVPLDQHLDVFLRLVRESGGVDFYSVRTYTPERPGQTVVIVKDRNYGNWRAFTFRFTPAPENLVASLGFGSAQAPADVPAPPLTEDQVLQETKDLARRLTERGLFSGALLIAKGEQVLLTMAGGEASKAFHVPNTVDTKFNLGSMNKMFTSTAVMRLAEQGRLSLDDPLGKYVDDSWLPPDVTAKITIRHLLTHTSGLGSYFNETYMRSSRALFKKLDDYKPLVKDEKPAFAPGTRYQYSNTGMFLLGVVIEKVTGEDYFDHIRKVIYGPAGMTNTDCYEMDYPVENLAIGFSPDPKSPFGWQNNLYKHVIKGGPAGGGFSTVKDLHRFAMALLAGTYVSKDSLKLMWTDYLGAGYGYGFTVSSGGAGKVVGHSGGFPGINSKLDIYLAAGYIVAVMSNIDSGASPVAAAVGQKLARLRK
ncbi:MAG: beta-lactamase family protein [Candidatus Aminicenantes bacterium]|nr:beta-lactamase family protein [Candidatus Aminicenantes bacterium]